MSVHFNPQTLPTSRPLCILYCKPPDSAPY